MVQIEADTTERETDYEIDSDNFFKDFVNFSRSRQVGNEPQSVVVMGVYLSGLLPSWKDYCGCLITGSSASGKSHLKQEVVDSAFDYVRDDWLYDLTAGSSKALVDDDAVDDARVLNLNELQKIPTEMAEMIKSLSHDGGFDYGRNVSDDDDDTERTRKTRHIHRDPASVVFMLADENTHQVEQELGTRLIEVKVDESVEKNEAVHEMQWGKGELTMQNSEYVYGKKDKDLDHAVRDHVSNAPLDTDVVIPTGRGAFEGDDWDASAVVKPMINFERPESTRASGMTASLVKAFTVANHHAVDRVEWDGETALVARPEDVATLIACRETLLPLTHGLDSKKFAALDAIRQRGGPVQDEPNALACDVDDIKKHVSNAGEVSNIKKNQLRDILREMDDNYLIDIRDHPENGRKNQYVFDGTKTFKPPAIDLYPNRFDVQDPVRDQPLEETVKEQQQRLQQRTQAKEFSMEDAMGGSAGGSSGDTGIGRQLSKNEDDVLTAVEDTADGLAVADMDDTGIAHLVGAAETDVNADLLTPVEGVSEDLETDWESVFNGATEDVVESIFEDLRAEGYIRFDSSGDETVVVVER